MAIIINENPQNGYEKICNIEKNYSIEIDGKLGYIDPDKILYKNSSLNNLFRFEKIILEKKHKLEIMVKGEKIELPFSALSFVKKDIEIDQESVFAKKMGKTFSVYLIKDRYVIYKSSTENKYLVFDRVKNEFCSFMRTKVFTIMTVKIKKILLFTGNDREPFVINK